MAGRDPKSYSSFRGAASPGEPKRDRDSSPPPSPRSVPSSREPNNYRNPSPPPFIRLEGGRPAQLTHAGNLPRVDEENCVRHVYLLYQQPSSGADDDEPPRDRGVPIVPGPEAIAIEGLAAHEVYPPADARLDWVGSVHVLEFFHDPRLPASEQRYASLYQEINGSDSDAFPATPPEWEPNFGGPMFVVGDSFQPKISLSATLGPQRFRLMVSLPHVTFGRRDPDVDPARVSTLEAYCRRQGALEGWDEWNRNFPSGPGVGRRRWTEKSKAEWGDEGEPGPTAMEEKPGAGWLRQSRSRVNWPGRHDADEQQMFVHQSIFMVINSDMIMMARTASNEQSSPLPFFPYQHRVSALHLLVHMISTMLKFSSRPVLDQLSKRSLKLDLCTQRLVATNPRGFEDEEYEAFFAAGTDTSDEIGSLIADLSGLLHLTKAQLQALGDLADVLWHNSWGAEDKGFNHDVVRFPLPMQREEHSRIVMDSLTLVIDERMRFEEQLKQLLRAARKEQKYLLDYLNGKHNLRAESIRERALAALHRGNDISGDYARFGISSMTMIMVITAVFLPLIFFSTYFGLAPGEQIVQTEADFWMYAAVPTGIILLAVVQIWLRNQLQGNSSERIPLPLRQRRRIPDVERAWNPEGAIHSEPLRFYDLLATRPWSNFKAPTAKATGRS